MSNFKAGMFQLYSIHDSAIVTPRFIFRRASVSSRELSADEVTGYTRASLDRGNPHL